MKSLLETINRFSDVACVRVGLDKKKKEGIWLGQWEPIIDPNVITWSSHPLKSLGLFLVTILKSVRNWIGPTDWKNGTSNWMDGRQEIWHMTVKYQLSKKNNKQTNKQTNKNKSKNKTNKQTKTETKTNNKQANKQTSKQTNKH